VKTYFYGDQGIQEIDRRAGGDVNGNETDDPIMPAIYIKEEWDS
jgi:hypothetical protein